MVMCGIHKAHHDNADEVRACYAARNTVTVPQRESTTQRRARIHQENLAAWDALVPWDVAPAYPRRRDLDIEEEAVERHLDGLEAREMGW